MAEDCVLVINALLCFVLYAFKKHPFKFISSLVNDFYDLDSISEAKELFVSDIEQLNIDKWVKPPTRRGDNNKRKHDLDDILLQLGLADEGGYLTRLPKYVVDNLDNIPIIRMERGEFAVLVSKLDRLSDDLSTLNKHDSSMAVGHCPPVIPSSGANVHSILDDIRRIP